MITLWVSFLAIKAPVITRSVLWRAGWLLTNRWQLRWIDNGIIQWRRHIYHRCKKSLLFEWLSLQLNHRLSRGFFSCLPWLFPVPLLLRLTISFVSGMMNVIWACVGVVCLLFYLLMAIKRLEKTLCCDNCSHVWF